MELRGALPWSTTHLHSMHTLANHAPAPPSGLPLPAEGDDRGTKFTTGGKRTVRPGDIGHQEDIGEWQGGHGRGYSKDHSGRSFIGIHPVSLLSDLETAPDMQVRKR